MALDLDDWLPEPQIRTFHRRSAHADADELWHAAQTVKVCDVPSLGRVVRWRIPGTPRNIAYADVFRRYPFVVLDEGERSLVSGLAGKIWTVRRDYPRLSTADEFVAWDKPGTVRVLFAHWVEEDGDRPTLVSEGRVQPVDGGARLRTRAVWAALGHFEGLIGGGPLREAARRAEGAS